MGIYGTTTSPWIFTQSIVPWNALSCREVGVCRQSPARRFDPVCSARRHSVVAGGPLGMPCCDAVPRPVEHYSRE
jgi:hypothetical protein